MFRFVTFGLGVSQVPEYDLEPKTSFLLKSLGWFFEFFTSEDVVAITRVPSTTHCINPEVVLMAMQLLVHWLGNKAGMFPTTCSDDPCWYKIFKWLFMNPELQMGAKN